MLVPKHWLLLSLTLHHRYGLFHIRIFRGVWRYHKGKQNPYIEEEQTTQWSREKFQKDTKLSTKHTYKAKDRVTRTPLKTGVELRCSGRVSRSCSTNTFLFLCRWCRNVATYRWKEDNGKFNIASFVTKCYS